MHHFIKQSHWFIVVLGLIITAWATMYVNEQMERKALDAFSLKVQDFEATVVRRMRSYEDILYGVAGLYRASDNVTQKNFEAYGDSLNVKERFPALVIINFAKYVSNQEREAFTQNFSADIKPRRGKVPLSLPSDHDEYMVITRVYPPAMSPILGNEIFQASARRLPESEKVKIVLRSQDFLPDAPFSSGLLLRPPGTSKFSAIASRLAVFKNDKKNKPRLIGTSGIGFDVPLFFKETIPKPLAKMVHYKMINIGRTDGTRYNSPIGMFDSRDIGIGIDPDKIPDNDLLKKYFEISFGGTLLHVDVFGRRDDVLEPYENFLPAAVFLGGLLFFCGIGQMSQRILSDNAALDAAVKKRTIELQCEVNRTKSLERELAAVIESERTRIGRELHDNLGQRLTGISVSAEILATELLAVDRKLSGKADAIGQATSEAMIQVRSLAHGLMPATSGEDGLRDALADLAASTSALSGINCTFDFDDPVDIENENIAAHLYRIAQEALNNALRHAQATSIDIRLDYFNGKVGLSVVDDGRGFNPDAMDEHPYHGGLGLSTIRSRASTIGYSLEIRSSTGNGTIIKVAEC
jgi:signal transduction histidine kinase